MLVSAKQSLALPSMKWRGCLSMRACLGVRYKSESTRNVDDFPYQYLKRHDASHMSAKMESTTRLPLRSFFAQHRPLMPFGRPVSEDPQNPADSGVKHWVHVPVDNGRFPIFMADDRPMWYMLPEDIARKMGPFNRDAVMSTKWHDFQKKNDANMVESSFNSQKGPMTPSEMQYVLQQRFPILMEHLQKMTGGDGELRVIPLSVEKVGDDLFPESMEATSVRRKRKLKMNRHKYRKRLKEQRTKRRRLGK